MKKILIRIGYALPMLWVCGIALGCTIYTGWNIGALLSGRPVDVGVFGVIACLIGSSTFLLALLALAAYVQWVVLGRRPLP